MSREPSPQERMLDMLAQEARVLKPQEARMLPDSRPLTSEEIDAIRRITAEYFESAKVAFAAIAKQIGRPQSVVSSFFGDKYKGDNEKIARAVHTLMEQAKAGADPTKPRGFVSTTIAERMMGVIRHTQRTRTIGVIYGPSGVSKSTVAQACAQGLVAGSVYVPCAEPASSMSYFLQEWCYAIGGGRRDSSYSRFRCIVDRLKGTGRLQLIDDVQLLSAKAINAIRDIHKQADVGVVLLGTHDAEAKLNDFHEQYGQMERLRSGTYDILEEHQETGRPLFDTDEVASFVSSMQLRIAPDALDHLTDLANEPGWGGLGTLRVVLEKASIAARHRKASRIEMRDILLSEQSRRGFAGAQRAARRITERRRKVAVA